MFYGASPILIPQGQKVEALAQVLKETNADIIFALAGAVSLSDLKRNSASLKQITWVVEQTSRHMDFMEPELDNNSSEYHSLIEKHKDSANSELPTDVDIKNAPNVISVWQGKNQTTHEIVEFTQPVSRHPKI